MLKDALSSLIPQLPAKPAFLLELMALKDKISGSIAEFKKAAAALIEKWGKVVGGIVDLINSLANLSICDLLTLNFKMNPDGSIVLEGPPPKTPTGGPEIPAEAPITTTSNLPKDYVSTNDAAVGGCEEVYAAINNSPLGQKKISLEAELADLSNQPSFKTFSDKAKSQGKPLSNTTIANLDGSEKEIQDNFIFLSKELDNAKSVYSVVNVSTDRVIEQIVQEVYYTDPKGSISSESIESLIGSLPSLVDSASGQVAGGATSAGSPTITAVQAALREQWKPIVLKRGQNIEIPTVEVIEGQTFATWFDSQGFKNFSSGEFTSYFNRPLNTTPPVSIWANILPTLRIVDQLATQLGTKIKIVSSYRSPSYNSNIKDNQGRQLSAKNSFHTRFMALDIQASGVSPSQVYNILKSWRNQGQFRGGLGLYSSFVHIDTRGSNVDW
jgi:lysozyme